MNYAQTQMTFGDNRNPVFNGSGPVAIPAGCVPQFIPQNDSSRYGGDSFALVMYVGNHRRSSMATIHGFGQPLQ